MINKLINLGVKMSGLGWVWEKVDGSKTYLAAAISILSGAAGVLSQLLPALQAHDAAAVIAVLKHLPQDQAFLMLMLGIKALGLRHAVDKAPAAEAPKP